MQYEQLLEIINVGGRSICGVGAILAQAKNDFRTMLTMRHDVDRLAGRAMRIAALEARRGIATTYYFRATRDGRFSKDTIRAISNLGHEVGYHYETLSQFGGRLSEALEAFHHNLEAFRKIACCHTVCMHGAPLSRYDNFKILDHLDLAALGLRGDAFRHMSLLQPVYITDTGGRWNADRAVNRRDVLAASTGQAVSPDDIGFQAFLATTPRLVYINVHPERWPSSAAGRLQAAITDQVHNTAKRVLGKIALSLSK